MAAAAGIWSALATGTRTAADVRVRRRRRGFGAASAYHVQSFERLNMVMAERNGRWVCLIGEVPVERLMDFAAKLSF